MTQLFKDSGEALHFAFRFSSQQYPISEMARLMKSAGRIGTGKGLIALDGAGQAGMILAELEKLRPIEAACIVCRYSERIIACECRSPCCRGEVFKKEYADSVDLIDREIAKPALTGHTKTQMRHAIIRHYFEKKKGKGGQEMNISKYADLLKVPRSSAHVMKTKIHAALVEVDKNARTRIDGYLSHMIGEIA